MTINECFTIIDIPYDNNSQFACIGWYTNESQETVRQNIIEELTLYKTKYIQLFKKLKILNPQSESSLTILYNNYINGIKSNDIGDNITLIAASNFYNINICVNESKKIFVDEVKPIDLYLELTNNHYNVKIKYNNEITKDEITDNIKYITVFDNPSKYNVEHPLNDNWTFWVNNIDNPKATNWLDTIVKLISVNSIEQFWCMYNNIPLPSQLIAPTDFYLFKNDIIPMWEDDENKHGGKITIILKKNINIELLNSIWLDTILLCIGNAFYDDINNTDSICGIVLNIRKHQSDEMYVNNVIYKWKKILDIKLNMSFISHSEQNLQK
jgi:translation initiation factor 4E